MLPAVSQKVIPWDGQKITKAGVYSGIPLDVYHGDICDAPSISSSGVRTIEAESLLHYYDTSYLNPDAPEREQVDHFNLGSAIHDIVAGEDNFREKYVIRPDKWKDWRTNDAKAWRAEQVIAGKKVLQPDDIEIIRGVGKQLSAHPLVREGILNGLSECSIFWPVYVFVEGFDKPIKVWLKSRPDNIPLSANMAVDLKTTASAHPVDIRRSIAEFGYHIQLAFCYEGLYHVWGRKIEDFVLVCVEKKRPYAINIKPLDYQDIAYGRRQMKRAIYKFARALATNEWPGYDDDEATARLPDWYRQRLAYEAENGLLPPLDEAGHTQPATETPEEFF